MDKATNNTISEYIKLVQQEYENLVDVYIFGSYVKAMAHRDSDIDLALIFKDLDDAKRFDVQVALMLLASQIDLRIEPHPIDEKDFSLGNPFAAEIKRTGRTVFHEAF